jgi:hypothetical protein
MLVSSKPDVGRFTCMLALVVLAMPRSMAGQTSETNGVPDNLSQIAGLLVKLNAALGVDRITSKQRTRLLLPFVSSQFGFDTGIAISNTGKDSSGIVGKAGPCTVYYFGTTVNGGPPPVPQVTTADIEVGKTLTFTLASGGSFGITGAAGFSGYLEIVCEFPFAHGIGFLTDGPIGTARIADSVPVLVLPTTRSSSYAESLSE